MFQKKNLATAYVIVLFSISSVYFVNCSKANFRAASSISADSPQGESINSFVCSSEQELVQENCMAKCDSNEVRNQSGVCTMVKEPIVCNKNEELFDLVCVTECESNQTRNSNGVCVANTPICNTATNELINGQCLVKCNANQTRDSVTLACKANLCSNGAVNYPSCSQCGSSQHLENAMCVSNSRICLQQPANTKGGLQIWANGSWGACTGYSCTTGYFSENSTCVKGCGEGGSPYWLLPHIGGPDKMCTGSFPQLRDGQKTTVSSSGAKPGFIKVSCVNSQYVLASQPSAANNEWALYQLKLFRKESVDIACNNDLILFQSPRLWESCQTSSTATCYAQNGGTPTETNACWPIKVFADDIGLGNAIIAEGKTLGQLFQTKYRFYIKTSKDNFAASYDITSDINAGYGLKMDVNSPSMAGQGKPPGFSFVARKDMENSQVKIFVEAKTYLNGVVRQQQTGQTLVKIRANSSCSSDYDGNGVANFTIGNKPGQTGSLVRKGYPWPLH
jgi:hypothetical protein